MNTQTSERRTLRLPAAALWFVLAAFSAALLLFEVLIVSFSFDAQAVWGGEGSTSLRAGFGYLGDLAKIGLLGIVVSALLAKDRLADYGRHIASTQLSIRRFCLCSVANLLSYAFLFYFSSEVFGSGASQQGLSLAACIGWVLSAFLTVAFWVFAFITPAFFVSLIRRERAALVIAALVTLLVWFLSEFTQNLWGPMSEWTFQLSAFFLSFMANGLIVAQPQQQMLGLGDFVVNIAPACSGYEGIGLVSAFTGVFVWLNRHELRFPHVLALFPIGAAAVWTLNALRIALLIVIGERWSPEIAVGGFHSQAGWLGFIATSLLVLWLLGKCTVFRKVPAATEEAGMNVPAATLVPFVALMAATLITGAFTSDFDWFYPLRVLAVAAALSFCWPWLREASRFFTRDAVAGGLIVALIWLPLAGADAAYNSTFTESLQAVSPAWAGLWLLLRFAGAAITVPIAEELAFRGYLLGRLSGTGNLLTGPLAFRWLPVLASSLAFGALHGDWLAGTAAGVVYALVRIRSQSVGVAIGAHAITNAILFGYAALTGDWHLI